MAAPQADATLEQISDQVNLGDEQSQVNVGHPDGYHTHSHTFTKEFLVHLGNNMEYPGFAMGDPVGKHSASVDDGWHLIPWRCPAASIQPSEWNDHAWGAEAVRCTGLSFELCGMIPTTLETETISGSTTLKNRICEHAVLEHFEDYNGEFDFLKTSLGIPVPGDTNTPVFRCNRDFKAPVCKDVPKDAILPRVALDLDDATYRFSASVLEAYPNFTKAKMPSTSAFETVNLYWGRKIDRCPTNKPISGHWKGETPFYLMNNCHFNMLNEQYFEGGLKYVDNNQISPTTQLFNPDTGVIKTYYNEIGMGGANFGDGLNRFVKPPRDHYVKLAPFLDQSAPSVQIHAQAYLKCSSTWEFKSPPKRLIAPDLNFVYQPLATDANPGDWYNSRQVSRHITFAKPYQYSRQGVRRLGATTNPGHPGLQLYGPPAQGGAGKFIFILNKNVEQ